MATREDLTPISIELREKDLIAMGQLQQLMAGPRIPQPGRMIPRGGEDLVSVRTELCRHNLAGVRHRFCQRLTRSHIPNASGVARRSRDALQPAGCIARRGAAPGGAVRRNRDDPQPVRAELDGNHLATVLEWPR